MTDLSSSKPLVASQETEERLKEKMRKIELQEQERRTEEKANSLGLGYIQLQGFPIAPEILSLILEQQARELQAVVFFKTDEQMRVAVADPDHPQIPALIKQFEEKFQGIRIECYVVSPESLEHALKLYAAIPRIKKVTKDVAITGEDLKRFQAELESFRELTAKFQKTSSMTDIVTMILAGAIKSSSSDIHIEAEEKDVKIRYRIDGILHDVATLANNLFPQLIARIKILSGLKINVSSIPQDGRITIALEDDKIDVRVSTLPTTFGESVVMRLLRSSSIGLAFDDLGIRGKANESLRREVDRPNGMILTTGPTGSGKTTTLYAILNQLNDPETKIITLEDPIEYKLQGINQSQIDHSKDYTFAKGLRAILRQDPDVIMVGEIRDLETAEIAIQSALTGHLVISTLHTNDASGAIPRLLAMGVKPFLLAPAINAVIGQRLVRRICPECREPLTLDAETLERVRSILSQIPKDSGEHVDLDNLTFCRSKGCSHCHDFGYKGRIGIYEVFTMNPEIEKIVLSEKVSEYAMKEVAVKSGMITMIEDGLLKALDGITTVEEVFRVTE